MSKPIKTYVWKDPVVLSRAAIAVLVASIAVSLTGLAVWVGFGSAAALPDGETVMTRAQWLRSLVALATLIVWIAGLIPAAWLVRMSRNAHTFKPGMRMSPLGAIGWYVVPFACLVKPYEAMAEIWSASSTDYRRRDNDLLKWWWGLFIANGAIGMLASRMEGAVVLQVLAELFSIALAAIVIVLVRRLTAMQLHKRQVGVFGEADESRTLVLQSVAG